VNSDDEGCFGEGLTTGGARDAAERIAVEYEPLPSVTATEEALSPAAPKLWAECDNNECFFFTLGDKLAVETAFAKAHHVTRIKLIFNRVTAATMEPRGCIAEWDDHLGRFTLYVGTQRPHTARADMARRILHIPENAAPRGRRQLRHEGRALSRIRAGAVGLAQGRTADQMDRRARREHA